MAKTGNDYSLDIMINQNVATLSQWLETLIMNVHVTFVLVIFIYSELNLSNEPTAEYTTTCNYDIKTICVLRLACGINFFASTRLNVTM